MPYILWAVYNCVLGKMIPLEEGLTHFMCIETCVTSVFCPFDTNEQSLLIGIWMADEKVQEGNDRKVLIRKKAVKNINIVLRKQSGIRSLFKGVKKSFHHHILLRISIDTEKHNVYGISFYCQSLIPEKLNWLSK